MRGEVAVLGLGVMGACTLWRLAERGVQAAGFEQFQPGHALGASHGETRIIRTAYYEGPEYVPLAQASFKLWRDLESGAGERLLTMTGALMIGAPGSELVSGALRSACEHGLAHELLDAEQMRSRYPQHRLAAGEIALHEEDAGVLKPERCVVAAVRRARELGARVETGSAVPDVHRLAAEYDHVVVAAGAWLPALLPGFRIQVERQVMTWVRARDPDEFRPARFPVFMRETPAGGDRFGIPALEGDLVKVGIHHEGEPTDIERLDREVQESDRLKVEEFVGAALPGLDPKVQKAVVCMYSNTPDRHFLVGRAPGYDNVTVLGGFSGHGFKFATILGEVAADLATQGGTGYPIELFSPKRSLATA